MELISNKKNLLINSFSSKTKYKPKSPSKFTKELNLNHSVQNNIKKISNKQRYGKLKNKKIIDKFFQKYISEKLNPPKDKTKKINTVEKNNIETKIFYNSSDKSGFYKKSKAKITKIIKNKKIITDSSFRLNQKNISDHMRASPQEKIFKINSSPSQMTNINKSNNINKNNPNTHKRFPLKTINISELKSFEENQETNCTFLNHTNTNFSNSKNNNKNKSKSKNLFKINDIKLLVQNNNLNLKIKNNYPMIWQIIAFTKKYKKLYENLLKQNEELQKENEELKKKIENINDEVCILKEEDNINKEIIKENEDKVEELSNFIQQQNKMNESRLDDFKYMLYKKDEEIQRLSKELEKIDDSKRNIYLSLNNEIMNFKEKINRQNEEINKYKKEIELFQNESIITKNNANNNYNVNNVNNINNINEIKIQNNLVYKGNELINNKNIDIK